MYPTAAILMLVFCDIGQMRKIRKRPHDRIGLVAREFFQKLIEISAGRRVGLASETNRCLANGLNNLIDRLAFLMAQHITEQSAK